MRRALPAILATLGGLGLLASFHTAGGASRQSTAAPVTSPTATTGSSPPPSGTSPQSTTPAGTTPQTTAPAALKSHQQIDGPTVAMRFGDVQVRVTLDNGRITDVQPLKMPSDRRRSAEITQQVTPMLHDEVLQAQSGQIDLISGATYTSDAYQQSLQAALDQSRK